jgi:O-antigen/teichoic acid export membrane protein
MAEALCLFGGPTTVTLLMLGRQKLGLMLTLISLAFNALLSALLIPRFGLEGAAMATAASLIVGKCLQLTAVLRVGPLDPTPFGLARRLGWRPRA